MAVDSRQKRTSMIASGRRLPWFRRFTLPVPDSSVETPDRAQLASIYSGLIASSLPSPSTSGGGGMLLTGVGGGGGFSPLSLSPTLWALPSRSFSDNGVTPAVDNDPTYLVDDASANDNDLTQVNLANRPIWKDAIINGHPIWMFDGTDDYLEASSVGVIPYPFSLYSVFKADTTTGARTLISYGTTAPANEVVLLIVSGALWALAGGASSITPFTDTSNYHYASAVFEAETSRTIYLDGIAGTENTTNNPINFTGSHIRVGRRGGTTQNFDGNIAFTCFIPSWTLDKQQSLDTWVQSRFGL